jgi:predicted ester cyclase
VAEGDQVIGRWSMTGTHVGNLSIIRATSNPINLEVMAAFRFNDERIVESTLSYDLFTLVRQLGLVPELPGINPVLPLGVPA